MTKLNELKQLSVRVVREKTIKYKEPITSSDVAIKVAKEFLQDWDREVALVVGLGTDNIPNHLSIVHIGSLNRSMIHPREIFKTAIVTNCDSVMFIHNHPTGGLEPSQQDLIVTNALNDAGEMLGIRLLDSVIVSHKGYYSIIHDIREEF